MIASNERTDRKKKITDTQLTWEPQTPFPGVPGPALAAAYEGSFSFSGHLISGAQVTQLPPWSRLGERPRASDPRGPLPGGNCAK